MTVVAAEGVTLERVREAMDGVSPGGLSREAYAKCDTAQIKTAWGRRHQRQFALVDGPDVLASATQYELSAVLDQRPVRVCGIGAILTRPAHRGGGSPMELVERLLDRAARDGVDMALYFSDMSRAYQPTGLDVVPMTDVELTPRRFRHSRRLAPA